MTQEWQQRVIDEKAALDEKITKLEKARADPWFEELNPYDRQLLISQLTYMRQYSLVLGQRIERFR